MLNVALKSEQIASGNPEGHILSGQTLTYQVLIQGRMSPAVRMTVKASGTKRPSFHVPDASPQTQRHDGNMFS